MKEVTSEPAFPTREPDSHKGSFGTLNLLAGSRHMLGAAILASRGALRSGVGLCCACLPEECMPAFATAVPCATSWPRAQLQRGFLDRATAVVIGPGLGMAQATRDEVRWLLENAQVPIVLDADGLNMHAPLLRTVAMAAPSVLTPHPGEAARLLDTDTATVQSDRRGSVEELVHRSGQIVVLKGSGTLICDGSRVFRSKVGNDGLATAGSGDVLAGVIGSLLAQGMDPFDAACLGVVVHGKAGDLVTERLSKPGLIAEDLPLAIAEIMR